jgi:hypothetical protein
MKRAGYDSVAPLPIVSSAVVLDCEAELVPNELRRTVVLPYSKKRMLWAL